MNKRNTAIIPESIKPFKTKYKLYVFLVCLFLSTLIWLVVKFSKTYEISMEVRIDYVNIPQDKFIVRADTVLNFNIKSTGFGLLNENLKKINRISIDLSRYPLRKSAAGTFESLVTIGKETRSRIHEFYTYAEEFSDITPGSLSVVMQGAYGKWVPVKPDISFTPDKQHFIYGDVLVHPDSVYVTGSKNTIERIFEIKTGKIDLGIINESKHLVAALPDAKNKNYHLSLGKVNINIPIERFTETTLDVPISIPLIFEDGSIKLFPERAKIVLLVALKDFNEINPNMFDVSIDTNSGLTGNILPLRVSKAPPHVSISRIIPETVEFIKIRQ